MKYIGNMLQIAVGVFIGMGMLHMTEFLIATKTLQIALRGFNEAAEKREERRPTTRIEIVEPMDKETCLKRTDGKYNNDYVTCREGVRMTVRFDPATGKSTVIRSEPIKKNVNVTSGK